MLLKGWLVFVYLVSITFQVVTSCQYDDAMVPKEGFLRTLCVPGPWEGSCLIILSNLDYDSANTKCHYEHGGRLATAALNEDFYDSWLKRIHYDPEIAVDKDTRFWIGYNHKTMGFNDIKPSDATKEFFDEEIWNNVFIRKPDASISWEGQNKPSPNSESNCPDVSTVFNPNTGKASVIQASEKHYALCETPRWNKLRCDAGWYLIPKLRMCLKIVQEKVNFFEAQKKCQELKSFIAVPRNENEGDIFRVFMELERTVEEMWVGIKAVKGVPFTLDGTIPQWESTSKDTQCAIFFRKDTKDTNGDMVDAGTVYCISEYFYACQRFADQSLSINV